MAARIGDKVVSDGKNVVSLVNTEEKLALQEYVDSQQLEKDVAANAGGAAFSVLQKLGDDESRLNNEFIALKNALSDWLGDLQSEIRVAGPEGSKQIFDYFEKISEKEKGLSWRYDSVKANIDKLRSILKVDLVTLQNNPEKLSEITTVTNNFVIAAKAVFENAAGIKKLVDELDKYASAFNAKSAELRNYSSVEDKLDDLLEGKRVYSMYSLEQRYNILVRVLRTKSIIKLPEGELSSGMLKDNQSLAKIKRFMQEYEQERNLSMSNLVIENPKHNEWMYYNDSLARLRQKGFKRHLRPIEFYAVLLEHFRTNGQGTREEIAQNMLKGKGEWLSVAFKKEGNMLHIAFDPENLAWNKKENKYDGNLTSQQSFDIGNKEIKDWISVSSFPSPLIEVLYGTNAGELSNFNAEIYLPPDGSWWPVGCGYNFGSNNFNLVAYDNRRASRGVK